MTNEEIWREVATILAHHIANRSTDTPPETILRDTYYTVRHQQNINTTNDGLVVTAHINHQLDRAHNHLRKIREQCIEAKHPMAVGKVCVSCIITDHLINNENDDDE